MTAYSDLQAMAEGLRGLLLRSRSFDHISQTLQRFLEHHPRILVSPEPNMLWVRARRSRDGAPLKTVSDILYPPQGAPTFGRANTPGSKVLYASWNVATALDEIAADEGELIQLTLIRPRDDADVQCFSIGDIRNYFHTGRPLNRSQRLAEILEDLTRRPKAELNRAVFVDATLSEIFRSQVKRPFEYQVSAAFSSVVRANS